MKARFFSAPSEFRAWLALNHTRERELLVGFRKVGSGKPSITWPESVDEALCFGWIDGVRRTIDDEAYSIRFTPRKTTSTWSAINVARVQALTKAGRMQPAGLRAFRARRADKTGVYSFERLHSVELTPAHDRKLRANRKAAAFFDAQPPGYRRKLIHWVVSAKQAATQERRLERLIDSCAAGKRLE